MADRFANELGAALNRFIQDTALVLGNAGEELLRNAIISGLQPSKPKHTGEDPYSVLGLPSDASIERVHDIHRRLSKLYHPDSHDTGNAVAFKRIQEAYESIMKMREK
jgi:preprotein translocase subunit Sec63